MLAPEIATRAGDRLAGIILLAAPARPIEDTLVDQFTYLHSLGRMTDAQFDELKQQVVRLRERRLGLKEKLEGMPATYLYEWSERSRAATGKAEGLKCRILVLQGGRDYQVTREDYELWKRALASRPGVECRFFEDLNHLFQAGQGMATPQEYLQSGSYVDPAAIEAIADWLGR